MGGQNQQKKMGGQHPQMGSGNRPPPKAQPQGKKKPNER
jgi:hypothetical protein